MYNPFDSCIHGDYSFSEACVGNENHVWPDNISAPSIQDGLTSFSAQTKILD
jgi:hypothetical protein